LFNTEGQKVVVVKIGGSQGTDFAAICADVAARGVAGEAAHYCLRRSRVNAANFGLRSRQQESYEPGRMSLEAMPMGKTKTLAVPAARKPRSAARTHLETDESRPNDIYETMMALFRQGRSRKRKPCDMKKALAALERLSGYISHGSLAQDIDEELYGPMR